MSEKIVYKSGGNESAFFADLTSAIENLDRDKEWKERRADKLAELLAQVAAIKAEIEQESKPKKRLMTPAECAGKWVTLATGLSRELVHGYDKHNVNTRGNNGFSPEFMHAHGWKIADTPTSEPYSLEVEE